MVIKPLLIIGVLLLAGDHPARLDMTGVEPAWLVFASLLNGVAKRGLPPSTTVLPSVMGQMAVSTIPPHTQPKLIGHSLESLVFFDSLGFHNFSYVA